MKAKFVHCKKLNVFEFSFFISFFTIAIIAFSCMDNGVNPIEIPANNDVLFVSIDGAETGIWVFKTNTFELIDSLVSSPGVPYSIEFSPDNNTWYSTWGHSGDYSVYTGSTHPLLVTGTRHLQYSKYALVKNKDYLVCYGYKGIDLFNSLTLELIHQDTSDIFGGSKMVASKLQNIIYFPAIQNLKLIGIGIYDLDSMKIIRTLELFNDAQYPGLEDADLAVSPDDCYLFLSAWNWRGMYGFNSFFVIDVINCKIVQEYPCGPFAHLAISPDGKNVYISKAGYNHYGFPPDDFKTYVYNIQSGSLNEFMDRGGSTGMVVSSDNNFIFLADSKEIEKINVTTKQVISRYVMPLDSGGYFTNHIRNISLNQFADSSKFK